MDSAVMLAAETLTSPMVLFFILGVVAALARSDLAVPEAVSKALALYLLFAIGFKGGASVAEHGVDIRLGHALLTGVALSAATPLLAFALLRAGGGLSRIDAGAVAAHYGSISIVTFTAGVAMLNAVGLSHEGWMVAVAAAMEAPAILVGLMLARGARVTATATAGGAGGLALGGGGEPLREAFLNGAVLLLMGAFAIGWATGEAGRETVGPFVYAPFAGVLCLFLLEMGLSAGRGLSRSWRDLGLALIAFGVAMPLIGALIGGFAGWAIGLSEGGAFLMAVLTASASYIAAPAAMRTSLPEARPEIYLTLSLGVTFPFNLLIGLPLYLSMISALYGPTG